MACNMKHDMQTDYEHAYHLNMEHCFKVSNCKLLGSNKLNTDINPYPANVENKVSS